MIPIYSVNGSRTYSHHRMVFKDKMGMTHGGTLHLMSPGRANGSFEKGSMPIKDAVTAKTNLLGGRGR